MSVEIFYRYQVSATVAGSPHVLDFNLENHAWKYAGWLRDIVKAKNITILVITVVRDDDGTKTYRKPLKMV